MISLRSYIYGPKIDIQFYRAAKLLHTTPTPYLLYPFDLQFSYAEGLGAHTLSV